MDKFEKFPLSIHELQSNYCWFLIIAVLALFLAACAPHQSTTPSFAVTTTVIPTTAEFQTLGQQGTIAPTSTPLLAIPSRVQPLDFELLGVPASYKPIESHWSLWDLQLWHDRIYLAHGDWSSNTGPMEMIYYDLNSGEVVHDEDFIVDEEALEIFRVYDDTLYAPGSDATEGWEFGNIYFKRWGEPWIKRRSIPSGSHIWDIALFDKTLITIGTAAREPPDSYGAVWISRDDGQSWEWGPDLRAGGYTEATSLFVLGDMLYVTTTATGCLVFDGISWSEADCLIADIFVGTCHVHKNARFENVIAMAPNFCVSDTHIHFFDGEEHWAVDFGELVHDVVSTDDGLYVLSGEPSGKGAIYYSPRLTCHCAQDFTRIINLDMRDGESPADQYEVNVCPMGNTPHSFEYANNRFYVGLADGRLFRSEPYQP